MLRSRLRLGVILAAAACGDAPREQPARAVAAPTPECRIEQSSIPLPVEVRESSGIAASQGRPGVFWTHNDSGGDPVIWAVDASGRQVGWIELAGAQNKDWEDIAVGPCDGGRCVYVADIGDNSASRGDVELYRVPEPATDVSGGARADMFRLQYPDGPRDAEALFVLPTGELFVISKNRQGPATLYRVPRPLVPGQTATLERVREIAVGAEGEAEPVTGADASPDGRWVAVRTNNTLAVFRTPELLGPGEPDPVRLDLRPLGEAQGEGITIADDGAVWVTSEGGSKKAAATAARLACTLP